MRKKLHKCSGRLTGTDLVKYHTKNLNTGKGRESGIVQCIWNVILGWVTIRFFTICSTLVMLVA
jgi:hypothetical protein